MHTHYIRLHRPRPSVSRSEMILSHDPTDIHFVQKQDPRCCPVTEHGSQKLQQSSSLVENNAAEACATTARCSGMHPNRATSVGASRLRSLLSIVDIGYIGRQGSAWGSALHTQPRVHRQYIQLAWEGDESKSTCSTPSTSRPHTQ